MSFFQNALQWVAEQAFPIVIIFCCLVIAYMVYAAAFRKRVLPTLLNRRVKELLHTPSEARKAYESSSRPAAGTSGSRPAAAAADQTREASSTQPPAKPL